MPRREHGLTLVEVLLSSVIFATAVTAGAWTLTYAAGTRAALAQEPATAALLAGHIHSLALELSREPSGMPPATLPAQVLALDNLDGAVFVPPIDAGLQVVSSAAGWGQQVDLSLADPTTPGLTRTWTTGEPYGTEMIKLTVTITVSGRPQGSFTWWLNP